MTLPVDKIPREKDGSLFKNTVISITEGKLKFWEVQHIFDDGSFVGIVDNGPIWFLGNPHNENLKSWPGWRVQPEEMPF